MTFPFYLLRLFGLFLLSEVRSLQDVPHDGQTFPRLQLGGQGQQTGVFDRLLGAQVQEHQQLRPERSEGGRGDLASALPNIQQENGVKQYLFEFFFLVTVSEDTQRQAENSRNASVTSPIR